MKEHMNHNQQEMFPPHTNTAEERLREFEKKRARTQTDMQRTRRKRAITGQEEIFPDIAYDAEILKKQKPKNRAGIKMFLDTKRAIQKAQREEQDRKRRERLAKMLEDIKKKS